MIKETDQERERGGERERDHENIHPCMQKL
jgi:hypothetical protein